MSLELGHVEIIECLLCADAKDTIENKSNEAFCWFARRCFSECLSVSVYDSWISGYPTDKIWIVVSGLVFFSTKAKWHFLKQFQVVNFQSSIYPLKPTLSCRTSCIYSTHQRARGCLSPWYTHSLEYYLCQVSRSRIHRWVIAFYNPDL